MDPSSLRAGRRTRSRSGSSRRRAIPTCASCSAPRPAPLPTPRVSSPRPAAISLLPGKNGLGGVLFGIEGDRRNQGPVSSRPPAAAIAGRRLPLRQRAARRAACGARLRARLLPLHALPQGRSAPAQARSAAKHRSRRFRSHRRSRDAGARPHQYAGERHGAGGTRGRPRASLRRATAPRSAPSSATICWRRIFR